jgi:hypothetical protein
MATNLPGGWLGRSSIALRSVMDIASIPDLRIAAALRAGAGASLMTEDRRRTFDACAEALALAARGFAVFPLAFGRKTPITTHGLHDASTDSASIRRMFPNRRKCNIAVATGRVSGIVAFDEDLYRQSEGLGPLERELGALPTTLEARTRAGGRHRIFKYPVGSEISSYNGKLAHGVDVKANGGYIVVAPSFVEADDKGPAGHYEWCNELEPSELPTAWVRRLEALKGCSGLQQKPINEDLSAGVGNYRPPDFVPEGQRNDALIRYVGSLRGRGLDEAAILEAAHNFNRAKCEKPLDDQEVLDVVGRYARSQPPTWTGTAQDLSTWPEPKPIDAPLPPVMGFDTAWLPAPFVPFVNDQAELMQCPPEFIAVPLMVGAAAALGNKIAIAPKSYDTGWLVAPVLWGGVVGRPGAMKSPAQGVAMRPLSFLESEMVKVYEAKRQQYALDRVAYEGALAQARKSAAKGHAVASLPPEPEEPQPERLVVNDSTVQKLGEILRWSPLGVLVARDELVSLMEQLGAEGQEGARGFYLTAWNGLDSYRIDRIGRGSYVVPRLALWLCGGIQPSKLQPYVRQAAQGGSGDDGFLQRVQLLVWPDVPAAWSNVDRPPDLAAMQAVDDTFTFLRDLDPVAAGCEMDALGGRPPWFHFNTEAQEVFDDWRGKHEASLRKGDKHPALESHLAKYRSLIPALALVIHLTERRTGPVGRVPLQKAMAWGYYLYSHAKRVYASATHSAGFSAKALADKISVGKLSDGFSAREVQRHGWSALNTAEEVRDALEWLVDAGWVRGGRVHPGIDGGRPKEVFSINPKVKAK